MYAVAAPPLTSTTLASKTGRTVPSAYARERRRTCCSWAKPGDREAGPAEVSVILASEPRETVRPMLVGGLEPGGGGGERRGRHRRGAGAHERGGDVLDGAVADPDGDHAAEGGRGAAEVLAEEHGAGVAAGELLVVDQGQALHLGGGEAEDGGVRAEPGAGRGDGVARGRRAEGARDRGDARPGCRSCSTAPRRRDRRQPTSGRRRAATVPRTSRSSSPARSARDCSSDVRGQPGRGGGGRPGELAEAGEEGGRGGDAEEPDGGAGHGASAGQVDRWAWSDVALTARCRVRRV